MVWLCCSSDGRSTTDDHWAVGVTLQCHQHQLWPVTAAREILASHWSTLVTWPEYWSLIGGQWPGDTITRLSLASPCLWWALYAAGELLMTAAPLKLASDWLILIIRGLWLAGADEGTSAIFETAACSDRRLCEDCLVLTPTTLFNENHPYDEDPSYKLFNHKRKTYLCLDWFINQWRQECLYPLSCARWQSFCPKKNLSQSNIISSGPTNVVSFKLLKLLYQVYTQMLRHVLRYKMLIRLVSLFPLLLTTWHHIGHSIHHSSRTSF